MAVRTESAPKSSPQEVIHTQMVFDRSGSIVHTEQLSSAGIQTHGHQKYELTTKHLKYQVCLGNRLFNCSKQEG